MLTALAMAASMAACGDKKTDETAADSTEVAMTEAGTESTEAETESEEVLPEGMYRSELTNELIDESLKNQRPIAVMVDNESIALPHYGLSQADVVYEMMNSTLNGRITRFMVLVKDWENIKHSILMNIWQIRVWIILVVHSHVWIMANQENIPNIFYRAIWTRTLRTAVCPKNIPPIMRDRITSLQVRAIR